MWGGCTLTDIYIPQLPECPPSLGGTAPDRIYGGRHGLHLPHTGGKHAPGKRQQASGDAAPGGARPLSTL